MNRIFFKSMWYLSIR